MMKKEDIKKKLKDIDDMIDDLKEEEVKHIVKKLHEKVNDNPKRLYG